MQKTKSNTEEVENHGWMNSFLELTGLKKSIPLDEEHEQSPEILNKKGKVTKEMIDKSFVDRETDTDRKILDRKISYESAKKGKENEKSYWKNYSKKERAALARTIDIAGDDEQLKHRLNLMEEAKEKLSFVTNEEGNSAELRDVFESTIEDFTEIDENGYHKVKAFDWKEMASTSWAETQESFFLFRPFVFLKKLAENRIKWQMVKKYEGEINLYIKAQKLNKNIKNKVSNFKEYVHQAKEVKTTISENPALRESLKMIRLRKAYRNQMHEIIEMKHQKKLSPKKFFKRMQNITSGIAKEGMENASQKAEFLRNVKENKFPGLSLKTTGKVMVVEVLTRGIMEGINTGSFGAFKETISDTDTLTEAIPLVGTWRSFNRLINDTDEPMLTRSIDFGVNFVGDTFLVAGAIGSVFTGGSSLIAATTARSAVKIGLKRYLTKRGMKLMAGKAVRGSNKAAKATANIAKDAVVSAGKWSAVSFGLQKTFEKYAPEGIVESIAVKALSPQQQRMLEMVR